MSTIKRLLNKTASLSSINLNRHHYQFRHIGTKFCEKPIFPSSSYLGSAITKKGTTKMSNQQQENNENSCYNENSERMIVVNDNNMINDIEKNMRIVVEKHHQHKLAVNEEETSLLSHLKNSAAAIVTDPHSHPVSSMSSIDSDRAYVICGVNEFSGGCSFLSNYSTCSNSFENTSLTSSLLLSKKNLQNYQKRKMSTSHKPVVQVDNINPNIVAMQYAVRGPLVIRAGEIEKELKNGVKKPFDEVIRANIGDCHAMGQKPITFLRQVMALTIQPSLIESSDYPSDVKERARTILDGCQGYSLGSYSDSAGIEVIRRQAANYIQERDGHPSDWTNVILTAGASQGIKGLLSLLRCEIDGKKPGVLVPIPQYPLYSATIAEFGMQQIGYYLDEANKWGLSIAELEKSINDAKKDSYPRAIVVINPGNPTGQVLTLQNIQEIIKFAYKHKLVIFADEVYQDNVYDKASKFHSFKKVLMEMGEPYNKMEMSSFMSCSKGYMGECGIRGGYMEIINFEPDVKAMFLKSISAQLCPTTIGQAALSCVVNPPKPGEPSYEKFIKEKTEVLQALEERAKLVSDTFNSFEGFSCNPVQGAMYAFPQFKIPPKAIEAAKKANKEPDVFYAFELLENSGICIVPGSGFGQLPGTYHFRTTILPQTEKLKVMLKKFHKFHTEFMAKYK